MSPPAKIQSVLAKPVMSALFFASGVTYDTLTLTRIDRLQDNLILLLYLVALGFLIVLTGRLGVAAVEPASVPNCASAQALDGGRAITPSC